MANDHGAVELAMRMKAHLEERGISVKYLGVDKPESVDYPDKAAECAKEYLKGGYDFAIVLCGTGIGISIAANKIRGIRCALVMDSYCAAMAKQHPLKILDAYLDSKFEGGRHERRVNKIMALESNQ